MLECIKKIECPSCYWILLSCPGLLFENGTSFICSDVDPDPYHIIRGFLNPDPRGHKSPKKKRQNNTFSQNNLYLGVVYSLLIVFFKIIVFVLIKNHF